MQVNPDYINRKIYGRKGTAWARKAGIVTNFHRCQLEGCNGVRLSVKWPDGKRTYPCSKGCQVRKNGDLEII